jgi:hypothetical protein
LVCDTEYLKVKKELQLIVARVLWLKVQKVCLKYQRKLYCITNDVSCNKLTLVKIKILLSPIAVKDRLQKIKEGYST